MTRFLSFAALILAPGLAAAQGFSLHPTPLLTPQPGTFYENGLGSPTVAYIPNGGSGGSGGYVMFFETRLSAAWLAENLPGQDYSLCAGGAAWGIGVAVSDDGVNNWTILGDRPLFIPEPGSYYGCIAAHPKALYDANASGGAKVQLFFKAETNRPTGGNLQTGVGLAQVRRVGAWGSLAGWEVEPFSSPVLALTNFGFPAVVQHEGLWYMWVAQVPSVYLATRFGSLGDAFSAPGTVPSFNIQSSPAIAPGATIWTPSRVYNPAALCRNNSGTPFTLFVGGKDVDSGTGALVGGGWGSAISANGTDWFISAEPEFSWTSSNDWRHWDSLLVQPGANECDTGPANADYLVYYAINVASKNQIQFAYTASSWVKGDTRTKVCENTVANNDFAGQPMERPESPPVSPAIGGFDDAEGPGASCSTAQRAPFLLALLAPLGLVLRRRR
jgi:hypothetical protein